MLSATHRPLSSSFLGLPYRTLHINHKHELLRGLWVMLNDARFVSSDLGLVDQGLTEFEALLGLHDRISDEKPLSLGQEIFRWVVTVLGAL